MQADVQNTGYAAGIAAAMAARLGTSVAQLDVRLLQQRLVEGGHLDPKALGSGDSFPIPDEDLRRAVADGLQSHRGIALCLAESARVSDQLRQAQLFASTREPAAMILALHGDGEATMTLRSLLRAETAWDAGWNFRGMGQFGMSMSRIDGLLVALAHCGSVEDAGEVVRFAALLGADADFSHLRAVAWAGTLLARRFPEAGPQLALALFRLVSLPGMQGHAQTNLGQAVAAARRLQGINENTSRNDALKELHLAAALLRCGDLEHTGRDILATYREDVRGHFSRHATAVLAAQPVRRQAAQR